MWVPLPKPASASQAQAEFRTLVVERAANRLRHFGRAPKLRKCIDVSVTRLSASGKRKSTVGKESRCLSRWAEMLGHLRVDHIRPRAATRCSVTNSAHAETRELGGTKPK